jgi:glycosyltransferase involved in cell wall biosynthesis
VFTVSSPDIAESPNQWSTVGLPVTDSVAFIESYPHALAGQQRTLLSLLEQSPDSGMDPLVITPGEGAYVDQLRSRGIPVEVFPYPLTMSRYGGAVYRDGILGRARTFRDALGYSWECRRKLKRLGPKAVFCNDMRGLLTIGVAARSLGIPVLIWDKLDQPHGALDWFQLPIATRNVIISSSVLSKYPRWQQRWYRNKILRIPDGADLDRIDRGHAIREQLGLAEDDVVIGIVGTVTNRKGHDRLLSLVPELVKQVPNARILVVGSWQGSEQDREFFESLPNRDHPRVMFLGQSDEIENIMHSIDLLTIPSRHEGLGLVTVEAMAAAKPAVGARVGGIPEVIVDGETGWLFEGDDRHQYLDRLVRLAESEKLRRRMGAAGRRRAETHFNRPQLMTEVCRTLRSMIDN